MPEDMKGTIALRRLVEVVAGQSPPSEAVHELEGGLPFIQGKAEFTARHPEPRWECSAAPKRAERGDLLLSVRAPVGAMNWADTQLGIGRGVVAVRSTADVDLRYVAYALVTRMSDLLSMASGSTFEAVTADVLAAVRIPVVTPDTGRRIADFLDDRVARIDRIITARRHQIAGLNGQVDAQWSVLDDDLRARYPVIPIRRVLRSIVDGPFGSSLTSSHYADEGTRVIRLGNVGLAEFRDDDKAYVSGEYGTRLVAHSVRPGDLIMAGLGDERWPLGRCTVAPPDLGSAIVKADCYRLITIGGVVGV